MKDRWEETLFHMAEQEQIIMPESLSDKIEEILCKPKNGKFHMNIRKSLILAAALILLCSATAIASVGALKERMEAMNREKMEEYFTQIYVNKIGADNYNRPYYDAEKERMETLQEAYENAEKKHIYVNAFKDTCPHCGKPQSWAVANMKNKLFENSIVSVIVGLIFAVGSYFYIKSEPGRFEESWQLGVPIGIMAVAVLIAILLFAINMVKMSSKNKKTANVMQKNLPDIQWDAVEGMIDMSRV